MALNPSKLHYNELASDFKCAATVIELLSKGFLRSELTNLVILELLQLRATGSSRKLVVELFLLV